MFSSFTLCFIAPFYYCNISFLSQKISFSHHFHTIILSHSIFRIPFTIFFLAISFFRVIKLFHSIVPFHFLFSFHNIPSSHCHITFYCCNLISFYLFPISQEFCFYIHFPFYSHFYCRIICSILFIFSCHYCSIIPSNFFFPFLFCHSIVLFHFFFTIFFNVLSNYLILLYQFITFFHPVVILFCCSIIS